jgi:asparagine synthase (glutamine-hydrolysing)
MCGIAGVVNLKEDGRDVALEALTSMVAALAHRGPDEFGVYRDRHAGLGHARLSIIDLSTGQQPLCDQTGTMWVVFNGEIFNYVELRTELQALGHCFRTRSDTEVIVHAYQQWRDDAFRRFNGQWALALWDSARRALVLARDPFGVRPLYVCEHHGRLHFASEVKAIFAGDASIPREFSPVGLQQVFTFWTTVAPCTVFRGIEELPPGCVRTYADGRVREAWASAPAFPDGTHEGFQGSIHDAAHAVRTALEEATRLRMLRADVPVGSYLSGGLDSSLVAALALRAKGSHFSTFSLRFTDAEYDETPHQREMAGFLESEHHEVLVSRADIARVFPEVMAHIERPVLRTAPAPLFLLSRLVRDAGIKVVLTGEGADEMFAGYDLFREAKVRRFWARHPESAWRPSLLQRLYPYLDRSPVAQRRLANQFFGRNLESWSRPGFGHDVRWQATQPLTRLFAGDLRRALEHSDVRRDFLTSLPAEFSAWTSLAQDQFIEIRTLLSGYLLSSQGDRMLMANSVEGRFPFLDRHVAALAESLPPAYKLRVLDEKHVLKRIGAELLPESIVRRKKQPYRAPDALSFAEPAASDWVDEVGSPQALADAGVFTPSAAVQVLAKCRAHRREGQFSNADNMAVVGILSTQLVHEQYIRRRPCSTSQVKLTTLVDRLPAASPTTFART